MHFAVWVSVLGLGLLFAVLIRVRVWVWVRVSGYEGGVRAMRRVVWSTREGGAGP